MGNDGERSKNEVGAFNTIAQFRKPLHYAAIGCAGMGIILTIGLIVVLFIIIGTIETPALEQVGEMQKMLEDGEHVVGEIDRQLASVNTTLQAVETSITSAQASFKSTGTAIRGLGEELEGIPLLGLGEYGAQLKAAGADLEKTAADLETIGPAIAQNQENLFALRAEINDVKHTLAREKNEVGYVKNSIESTFLYSRIGVILFGAMMILLYVGILALAITGLGNGGT